jgi:indolepyruvate ferredoxin oxidoreductase beta subunit
MTEKIDIFMTGVGGQGSLSASTALGEAATRAGLKVLVGEIHGMAQRGGVVESTVRIGNVHGPIIPDGQADVLLGFEPVESLRALPKASPGTLVVTNTHPMVPATVSMKGDDYPDSDFVVSQIRAFCPNTVAIDATQIAREAGNAKTMNTVLLGVVAGSGILPFDADILRAVVMANVPKKTIEANERAFDRGLEIGGRQARKRTLENRADN